MIDKIQRLIWEYCLLPVCSRHNMVEPDPAPATFQRAPHEPRRRLLVRVPRQPRRLRRLSHRSGWLSSLHSIQNHRLRPKAASVTCNFILASRRPSLVSYSLSLQFRLQTFRTLFTILQVQVQGTEQEKEKTTLAELLDN